MKSPEQLKGWARNVAAEKQLRAQEILQMFMFERLLERLAASPYQKNFILKGGLLISSMVGLEGRTTMDMDTTVRGIQMEEDEIVAALKTILAVDVGDGIRFEYRSIEPIREIDAYNNFRAHIDVLYGKINTPMKIDITTGDKITPAAVQYEFSCFDQKRKSPLWPIRWKRYWPKSTRRLSVAALPPQGRVTFTTCIRCIAPENRKSARKS